LVHGDLWCGNTLWDGSRLTAVLDWDCAGVGPPGIDLGSLRCDAAWCHGIEAAEHVLDGWEAETGRTASDVPYWDAVAALSQLAAGLRSPLIPRHKNGLPEDAGSGG
jgi:aminoglycoside phosphotransferase (APT) family kinase protein